MKYNKWQLLALLGLGWFVISGFLIFGMVKREGAIIEQYNVLKNKLSDCKGETVPWYMDPNTSGKIHHIVGGLDNSLLYVEK